MKSDVILVGSDGSGMEEAFAQVEAVAGFRKLSAKDTLHLRLLTEEMMGIIKAITGEVYAKYWIEDDLRPCHFVLHLTSKTEMDAEKRKQLFAVSSTGKNIASKGITGKLRDFFSAALIAGPVEGLPTYYGSGLMSTGLIGGEQKEETSEPEFIGWSMMQYRTAVEEQKETSGEEAWDELEKSIVAKLADDVQVGIRGNNVEMLVYKTIRT